MSVKIEKLRQKTLKIQTFSMRTIYHMAKTMIHEMRCEMSRYTWKAAIYLVLTIFFVLAVCVAAFTWFMNDGYSQIAEMQRMEAVWQKKAPLADIAICDGRPCVKIDTTQSYGDKKNTYLIIKK